MAQQSLVKGIFHYNYKNQGVILDQQYNYQGNILAVCNSNGDMLFYSGQNQQSRDSFLICQKKKQSDKFAILKIAWSLPIFGLFASASITKQIDIYNWQKNNLTAYACTKIQYIPLSLCFCPIQSQVLLTIGMSDGSIKILNENLSPKCTIQAHDEGVICLAWDHKILSYQKNKWITQNFSHVNKSNTTNDHPLLISGSNDGIIKIWKYLHNKLTQLHEFQAHSKIVRDVQWKPSYLAESQKYIISCSQDGSVKIWRLKMNSDKLRGIQRCQERNFNGPVYKANFNFLGNLIAVAYANEVQQKVETLIFKQSNGLMLGQSTKIIQ